ncbi:MAG: hypothetical protein AAB389_00195 [Patescibacteria group bacterium]
MSGASKYQIRQWLNEGLAQEATHVIIVCDTFDYEDYPVYVMSGQDARKLKEEYDGKSMQTVMEVYKLSMNLETQLAQLRSFNY